MLKNLPSLFAMGRGVFLSVPESETGPGDVLRVARIEALPPSWGLGDGSALADILALSPDALRALSALHAAASALPLSARTRALSEALSGAESILGSLPHAE